MGPTGSLTKILVDSIWGWRWPPEDGGSAEGPPDRCFDVKGFYSLLPLALMGRALS